MKICLNRSMEINLFIQIFKLQLETDFMIIYIYVLPQIIFLTSVFYSVTVIINCMQSCTCLLIHSSSTYSSLIELSIGTKLRPKETVHLKTTTTVVMCIPCSLFEPTHVRAITYLYYWTAGRRLFMIFRFSHILCLG